MLFTTLRRASKTTSRISFCKAFCVLGFVESAASSAFCSWSITTLSASNENIVPLFLSATSWLWVYHWETKKRRSPAPPFNVQFSIFNLLPSNHIRMAHKHSRQCHLPNAFQGGSPCRLCCTHHVRPLAAPTQAIHQDLLQPTWLV